MSEATPDTVSNTLKMTLKHGEVTIQLRPDIAPLAAERLRTLAAEGFYDGLKFHRVIADFMAQTGDPTGTGGGGSTQPNLPAEFTKEASFLTGTLGMARTQDPNSANSQFFICFAPCAWLDGQYTIVGQVTAGMEAVNQIKKGAGSSGSVQDPDVIVKMTVA
jgi:cyclophilin family peptidyl-prolyl cis-trans isomerase